MRNASDELKEQIRELARKQLQKAKKVGERAYDAAQQEADAKKPRSQIKAFQRHPA